VEFLLPSFVIAAYKQSGTHIHHKGGYRNRNQKQDIGQIPEQPDVVTAELRVEQVLLPALTYSKIYSRQRERTIPEKKQSG